MDCRRVLFSGHAAQRMFERQIGIDDVLQITRTGESIAEWHEKDGGPYHLLLGFPKGRALHVVLALRVDGTCHVVTVYEPDSKSWTADFRRRRS
jgi:hypothetical protein